MIFRIVTLTAAVTLSLGLAQASDLTQTETRSVERPTAGAADFGTYRIVPGVQATGSATQGFSLDPTTQAAAETALTDHDSREVVPTEGNVVFNEITNDYGVLTGFISVVAADHADVSQIASDFGLDVELRSDARGLGILYAGTDTDLVELAAAIRDSGLARAVEIEVQEQLNQPHY